MSSSNVVNATAYLRTSRDFPEDQQALQMELNKSYIDTANAINSRVIGVYSTNRPAINGEEWFLTASKQQGLRQVYPITGAGSIPHGINVTTIAGFTRIYGTFTDGTNWYPLPYVDVVSATNQVNIYVTPVNIVITAGAGAPPAITRGYTVLEWISQP
jgi:hypothetical protein